MCSHYGLFFSPAGGVPAEKCCNRYWNGEHQRKVFGTHACKQCQKRRARWGGGTSQAAFDASQAAAATDAEVAQAQKLKAYSATPSGSEMKAWLLFKGIDEDDVGRILINFIKPEYEITTLLEMFALENQDIAEVLQGLPLGKRKVLKMLVKQERDGI